MTTLDTIPPRCPVDDAPHTTCTSPDYNPAAPIVIVQLPCRDALMAATAAPPKAEEAPPPPRAPETGFTTATYRRAIHGPKRTAR